MKKLAALGIALIAVATIALWPDRYPSRTPDFTQDGKPCWHEYSRLTGDTWVVCKEAPAQAL